MLMKEIKLYGLQRTFTNYLKFLLEKNYDCKVFASIGGWKHGFYNLPDSLGKELDVVICTKNPYAWLPSLHRYLKDFFEGDLPVFSKWLRSPLVLFAYGLFNKGKIDYYIRSANPVQHWNNMNYHWSTIQLQSHKLITSRYEDILADAELEVEGMSEILEIQRKSKKFIDEERVFGKGDDAITLIEKKKFNKKYYLEKKYLEKYDKKDIEFVEQQLSPVVMKRLGYFFEVFGS